MTNSPLKLKHLGTLAVHMRRRAGGPTDPNWDLILDAEMVASNHKVPSYYKDLDDLIVQCENLLKKV